ncbi:MAG: hypothetical protein JWP89_7044 [Schlesneria sp.]|nr:hypothetical protein [Schlesneria sp.]
MQSQRMFCAIAIVVTCLFGNAISSADGRHCHRQRRWCQAVDCQRSRTAANTVSISIVPLEHRREHLVVRIDVTNCTSGPIVWDSEFASFVCWDLRSDDGSRIEPISVKNLDRTESSVKKSRFVTIRPGELLSKSFDLTSPFRHLTHGHGSVISSNGAYFHVPTGVEEYVRFALPTTARDVLMSVQYNGDEDFGGFNSWFGYSPAEIELWAGRTKSNEIRIPLTPVSNK